jgi:hypothetical protein
LGVYNERRRDPLPDSALCVYCGWSGTPNHAVLRDTHGSPALLVSQKPCPRCGRETINLKAPKASLPVEIVTAVRDADLTSAELLALADALRNAPSDASPRSVADQVPSASKLITIASRAGKHWLELLTLIVMAVALYVQHHDAQQAHHDAQQAHHDARRAHADAEAAHADAQKAHRDAASAARSTRALSDEDIERIIQQIERDREGKERGGGTR